MRIYAILYHPVRQLLAKFNSFCSFELIGAAGCCVLRIFRIHYIRTIDGCLVVRIRWVMCACVFQPLSAKQSAKCIRCKQWRSEEAETGMRSNFTCSTQHAASLMKHDFFPKIHSSSLPAYCGILSYISIPRALDFQATYIGQ